MLAHDDGDNDDRGNGSMRMRTAKTTEKTTAKSMATVMTATMTMGTTTNSDVKVDSDSDDSDNDDRDNDDKHDNGGYNDNDVGSCGGGRRVGVRLGPECQEAVILGTPLSLPIVPSPLNLLWEVPR